MTSQASPAAGPARTAPPASMSMFDLVRSNQRRTAVLVVVMATLMFLLGYVMAEAVQPGAGILGFLFALIVWLVMTLVAWFSGDQIFLSLSRAKKIEKSDHPVLFDVVEEMCVASGIAKMPDIYIIDDAAMNAFATGRDPNRASVAVTAGLLQTLNRDELQGVLGHELGHVRNRDILYLMMAGVMVGTIVMFADVGLRFFGYGGYTRSAPRRSSKDGGQLQLIILVVAILLMILAPLLARILYLAISRRREYLADASSAVFTRYPEGLANALEKIGHSTAKLSHTTQAMAPMYLVNPLKVTAAGLSDLSSTHPPISERIRILRSMGSTAGFREYDTAFRQVTGRAVGVVP
ncbi:MAG: M48 family metallopeptidase, partial [Thermoanaerobaculia bacterium]